MFRAQNTLFRKKGARGAINLKLFVVKVFCDLELYIQKFEKRTIERYKYNFSESSV